MRQQGVNRAWWEDGGQQDQLSVLTARSAHVLRPKEGLAHYIGRMPQGGLLLVPEGTWYVFEDLVLATPYLRIVGNGPGSVIACQGDATIFIDADRVALETLKLTGSATDPRVTDGLVTIRSTLAHIERVWVSGCLHGIVTTAAGDMASILRCQVTGRGAGGIGINVVSDYCEVDGNYIPDEAGAGEEMRVTGAGSHVAGNRMPGGGYTVAAGNSDIGNYV